MSSNESTESPSTTEASSLESEVDTRQRLTVTPIEDSPELPFSVAPIEDSPELSSSVYPIDDSTELPSSDTPTDEPTELSSTVSPTDGSTELPSTTKTSSLESEVDTRERLTATPVDDPPVYLTKLQDAESTSSIHKSNHISKLFSSVAQDHAAGFPNATYATTSNPQTFTASSLPLANNKVNSASPVITSLPFGSITAPVSSVVQSLTPLLNNTDIHFSSGVLPPLLSSAPTSPGVSSSWSSTPLVTKPGFISPTAAYLSDSSLNKTIGVSSKLSTTSAWGSLPRANLTGWTSSRPLANNTIATSNANPMTKSSNINVTAPLISISYPNMTNPVFPKSMKNATAATPISGFNDTIVTDSRGNSITQGPFDKVATSELIPTASLVSNKTNLPYNSAIDVIPRPTGLNNTAPVYSNDTAAGVDPSTVPKNSTSSSPSAHKSVLRKASPIPLNQTASSIPANKPIFPVPFNKTRPFNGTNIFKNNTGYDTMADKFVSTFMPTDINVPQPSYVTSVYNPFLANQTAQPWSSYPSDHPMNFTGGMFNHTAQELTHYIVSTTPARNQTAYTPTTVTSPYENSTVPTTIGKPLYNHTISLLNKPAPVSTLAAPFLNNTAPLLNHTAPLLNQTTPVSAKDEPFLNHTTPTLNHTTSLLNQTAPALTQATPLLNQTAPFKNTTASNISTITVPFGNNTVPTATKASLLNNTAPFSNQTASITSPTASLLNQTAPITSQLAPFSNSTAPLLNQTAPLLNQTAPLASQTAPFLNKTVPMISQAAPFSNTTAPRLNQTSPVVSQPAPFWNNTTPLLNQTAPFLNRTAPILNSTAPFLNQTAPIMNHTAPVLNKTNPGPITITAPYANFTAPFANNTALTPVTTTVPFANMTAPLSTVSICPESWCHKNQTAPVSTSPVFSNRTIGVLTSTSIYTVYHATGPVVLTSHTVVPCSTEPHCSHFAPIVTKNTEPITITIPAGDDYTTLTITPTADHFDGTTITVPYKKPKSTASPSMQFPNGTIITVPFNLTGISSSQLVPTNIPGVNGTTVTVPYPYGNNTINTSSDSGKLPPMNGTVITVPYPSATTTRSTYVTIPLSPSPRYVVLYFAAYKCFSFTNFFVLALPIMAFSPQPAFILSRIVLVPWS